MMINPNDIEISNNFSVVKSLLKCNVCNGIVVDPVQSKKCDKIYCKKCINNINCLCKGGIKSNEILKEATSKLVIRCKFKCGELIPFEKYKDHIEQKCSNINVKENFFVLNAKLIRLKAKENELNKKISKLKLNKVNYSKERMNLRLIILLTIFIYAILLTLMMEKSHHSNDPFIGHVLFQKYTIKRKLGEGSFGMIYQGESKDLKVAIKFEKQRPNRSSLLKSESEIMNSLQLRNKKKYNKYSWNS